MINLRISGLYNRGQQDEYVELEAAARCDLEGLMLVRYLYNAEGFPIYSQARLYEFPDTNLRKGNRVRLYSGFTKEKKVRTPEGVTYNFSWNLDTPIWDGNHVECYIMSPDERIGFAPCDPIEDHESPTERGTFLPLGEELGMSFARAIVEGNVQVHDETLGFVPLEVTGVKTSKSFSRMATSKVSSSTCRKRARLEPPSLQRRRRKVRRVSNVPLTSLRQRRGEVLKGFFSNFFHNAYRFNYL